MDHCVLGNRDHTDPAAILHALGDASQHAGDFDLAKQQLENDRTDRLRIVDKFREIRDLSWQGSEEDAAEQWDSAHTIQKFAKEIQSLLASEDSANESEITCTEMQDLGGGCTLWSANLMGRGVGCREKILKCFSCC